MKQSHLLRLFALVACLSWATASAQSVSVYMPDVSVVPGETVTIPVSIYCDVDMTSFQIRFSTDLGVDFTNAEFVDRIDPSANTYVVPGSGILAYNFNGIDFASLEAGDGVVAEFYLKIPADAEPGNYTMTLYDMQFVPIGTSGGSNTIYPNDVTTTLTVLSSTPQAYACYTSSNTTLTFYYDNLRGTRSGTTYDLNTGDNLPDWRTDGTNANVTKAVFNSSFVNARPTTACGWFTNMANLQTITGMAYLNTSEVTNMRWMFGGCSALTGLDVSNLNTDKVTTMVSMFESCQLLTSLDLSNFNTAKVTNMSQMFYGCNKLTSLNVTSFNTANLTNMNAMFDECSSLTSLDLSSFNTSKVKYMSWLFAGCGSLQTIYVDDGWTTAAVQYSTNMFMSCRKLVGGKGTTYDAVHVDKEYAHIDGGPNDPGYLSEKPVEAYACYTSDNTTLTFYYDKMRSTRSGITYDLNAGDYVPDWYFYGSSAYVTKVVFNSSFANARPTTTYSWFYDMGNLQSITGMEYLNTSQVTNMSAMFCTCRALTSIDLSHFNTTKVTDMSWMFADCENLAGLDVSCFNTAKVTNMQYMFRGCSGLTGLDLSSFNTSNVTNMRVMFYNCTGLTSLDLSSFNTSKVTEMDHMFGFCTNLKTIYAGSGWNTDAVTSSTDMFYNCTNLVGGKGTSYDANHTNKAYARIDGGTSSPGYFTAKFLLGDVNCDGHINVADVTALIQIVLNSTPVDPAVADINGDSQINVADVTALIQMVLNN